MKSYDPILRDIHESLRLEISKLSPAVLDDIMIHFKLERELCEHPIGKLLWSKRVRFMEQIEKIKKLG